MHRQDLSDRMCPLTRRSRQAPLLSRLVRQDSALCVTFVNTASAGRQAIETWDDLLTWGLEYGTLNEDEDLPVLMRIAAERPSATEDVVRRAQALRACLERLLRDDAAGRSISEEALGILNAELGAGHSARRLVPRGIGLKWGWAENGGEGRMLWPVVISAGNLLTLGHGSRIGRCAAEGCDLLFLDFSADRRRKWCSIRTCGGLAAAVALHRARIERKREWLLRNDRS